MESEGFVFSPIEPITPAAVEVNLWFYTRGAACELKACCKIRTTEKKMQKQLNTSSFRIKLKKHLTIFAL